MELIIIVGKRRDVDALLERHGRLVRSVVRRELARIPPHIDRAEIEAAALVGLWHAIEDYREGHGTSFATYGAYRIRGAIRDWLRRMDGLPRSTRTRRSAIELTRCRLITESGVEPTAEDLAQALDLSVRQVEETLEPKPGDAISLEHPAYERNDHTLSGRQIVSAKPSSVEEDVAARELRERLCEAMRSLPRQWREILLLRYADELAQREIGQIFGVTESRISQIKMEALQILREQIKGGWGDG